MAKFTWDHVHIRTPNVEETAQWFERMLGAEVIRSMQQGAPRVDLKVTTVPYKGTAPALNDLIGGQFDFMCDQTVNVAQPIKGGLIKGYAVPTKTRLAVLPDLPTTAEMGMAAVRMDVWYGMWAPKGTPKPVVDKLSAALRSALKDPEVKGRLTSMGAEILGDENINSEALRAQVAREVVRWKETVKKAGIATN